MIISLSGRRKMGKTMAANLLVEIGEELGKSFTRVAFADTLKEMYAVSAGISIEELNMNDRKEVHRSGLIKFAKKEREKDPLIFVKGLFLNKVEIYKNYVIDDLRYIEELQWLKRFGGTPYLVRANETRRRMNGYFYDKFIDNDLGESELGDLAAHTYVCLGGDVLHNIGTVEDLKKEVLLKVKLA